MALSLRVSIDALTPALAAATPEKLNLYADELVDLFDRATRNESSAKGARR
jgi:hypothetical protein